MASIQVDAAPVEEVKSQAEPTPEVCANAKEPEVHELDESTKTQTLEPHVEDKETLEIYSDEEEEEKEMESLVKKDEDFSPFTYVEQPAWPAEFYEKEDEDEEDDEYIYKV